MEDMFEMSSRPTMMDSHKVIQPGVGQNVECVGVFCGSAAAFPNISK